MHYETKTAIAAQNIGITRVGDKTYAIGHVASSQDEGFFRSKQGFPNSLTFPELARQFAQVYEWQSVTDSRVPPQLDSGKLQAQGVMIKRQVTRVGFAGLHKNGVKLLACQVSSLPSAKNGVDMKFPLITTCLILAAIAGPLPGQETVPDTGREKYSRQFEILDRNDDGNLDETELKSLSAADLQALQTHGLPESGLVAKEAFIAAGTAVSVTPATDVAKADEAKRGDASGSPLGGVSGVIVRNSLKKGAYVPGLPAEYSARDKNGDGQIALYEWDRKKLSEFTKLDKNGDGFLTPTELLPKESLKALYSKTARTVAGVALPNSQVPAATSGAIATPSPVGDADGVDKEAREKFQDLDGNKDLQIDEKEWGNSRRTRERIEATGAKITFPMNLETFLTHYRRARSSQR